MVRDLEGCRDTARYRRTYPSGTAATITRAARYTSACTRCISQITGHGVVLLAARQRDYSRYD